jgi:hypothetical protein
VKRILTTSTGSHLIEATTDELRKLLEASQNLNSICADFEFTITSPADTGKAAQATGGAGAPAESTAVGKGSPSTQGAMAREVIRGTAKGKKPCEHCGKPYRPKNAQSRYCSKSCIDAAYRKAKQRPKPAKGKATAKANAPAVYKALHEILLKNGPMTSGDLVRAAQKAGVDTDPKRASVHLSTYKHLFQRKGLLWTGKRDGSTPEPATKPAPEPATPKLVVIPPKSRLDAIREADRRARAAVEDDPLDRASRIASGIRAEDQM